MSYITDSPEYHRAWERTIAASMQLERACKARMDKRITAEQYADVECYYEAESAEFHALTHAEEMRQTLLEMNYQLPF